MVAEILTLDASDGAAAARGVEVLEGGGLLYLPKTAFGVQTHEQRFLDEDLIEGGTKNVSFDPSAGRISGTGLEGDDRRAMTAMMARYADWAGALLGALTPQYAGKLQRRRTSFRPGAVETRALSPRKDDKRLHVDAFPANPVQGRRILRVFTNVNPLGESRRWRIGDMDFGTFAEAFRSNIRPRGGGRWREAVGLTKGRRTPYDCAMLQLHDAAKADDVWQRTTPATPLAFPPGSTWVVFTDGVLHAALQGRHAFEQTYLLPVDAMDRPEGSPLRILETLTGSPLT